MLFQELRAHALNVDGDYFGQTLDEFLMQKERFCIENDKLDEHGIVGVFDGEKLVGMLGYYIKDNIKEKHKLYLWGLFILEEYRGQNLGSSLLQFIQSHLLRNQIKQVIAVVITPNENALFFYKKNGFKELSYEKDAFLFNEKYFGKMSLVLITT